MSKTKTLAIVLGSVACVGVIIGLSVHFAGGAGSQDNVTSTNVFDRAATDYEEAVVKELSKSMGLKELGGGRYVIESHEEWDLAKVEEIRLKVRGAIDPLTDKLINVVVELLDYVKEKRMLGLEAQKKAKARLEEKGISADNFPDLEEVEQELEQLFSNLKTKLLAKIEELKAVVIKKVEFLFSEFAAAIGDGQKDPLFFEIDDVVKTIRNELCAIQDEAV